MDASLPRGAVQSGRTWKVPAKHLGKDTGRFPDPKGVLKREVSKGKGRRYTESDAPDVFRAVIEGGYLNSPRGSNSSWTHFWRGVEFCARKHLHK